MTQQPAAPTPRPRGWRVFWPRHAKDSWDASVLPVRLAGDVPIVGRFWMTVIVLLISFLLLMAVATVSYNPDPAGKVVDGVLFTVFAVTLVPVLAHWRRSFSVVVSLAGIHSNTAASGLWVEDVGPRGAVDLVTSGSFDSISIDDHAREVVWCWGWSIPTGVYRLAFHGRQSMTYEDLTFSPTGSGLGRAARAARFLGRVYGVPIRLEPQAD